MTTNTTGIRVPIRYSEVFKMSVVQELERSGLAFGEVARKYGIAGSATIQIWVRKYGNGSRGKVIRVEKPEEIDQKKQLKERVRALERAVGSLHIELALERAYTNLACERAGIEDVAAFKKSRWPAGHQVIAAAGKRRGKSVRAVCKLLGMSTQNYYERRLVRQARAVDAGLVRELVQAERRVQPRLGTRKLRVVLQGALAKAGVQLGRDRFFEVLRRGGLLLAPLPKVYPQTTNSYHCLPVFGNLVKDRVVTRPNEVWVSDLTYLRTAEGFLYLALVTDKFSRKIVGYHCGDTLQG